MNGKPGVTMVPQREVVFRKSCAVGPTESGVIGEMRRRAMLTSSLEEVEAALARVRTLRLNGPATENIRATYGALMQAQTRLKREIADG